MRLAIVLVASSFYLCPGGAAEQQLLRTPIHPSATTDTAAPPTSKPLQLLSWNGKPTLCLSGPVSPSATVSETDGVSTQQVQLWP
eukprot:COSAG02_NODE_33256_length_503_cov_0.688119_1_plen_85_part_00